VPVSASKEIVGVTTEFLSQMKMFYALTISTASVQIAKNKVQKDHGLQIGVSFGGERNLENYSIN